MISRFKTLSVNQFTFITALCYVAIFNLPLFGIVRKGIENNQKSIPFHRIYAAIFNICAEFLFSIFTVKYLLKPFFIVLTLLSSSVFLPPINTMSCLTTA